MPATNGHAAPSSPPPPGAPGGGGVDPAVLLLVAEIRRGQDAMRAEMVGAQRETTEAVSYLVSEMRELRKQAPGKGNTYLATAIILLALLSMLGLMSTKGVDVQAVTSAAAAVLPGQP